MVHPQATGGSEHVGPRVFFYSTTPRLPARHDFDEGAIARAVRHFLLRAARGGVYSAVWCIACMVVYCMGCMVAVWTVYYERR